MHDWKILEVREDVQSDDGERWLVIFQVPLEYSSDGIFSYSFLKSTFNFRAAEFDYDIDDEDELDELFEHVMYEAFTVHQGVFVDPHDWSPSDARDMARETLRNAKKDVKMTHQGTAKMGLRQFDSADDGHPFGQIRKNMRIDPAKVNDLKRNVQSNRTIREQRSEMLRNLRVDQRGPVT